MAGPTPSSTTNDSDTTMPLLDDADVGESHEAEALVEDAELMSEDGDRGMAQQGRQARDTMAETHSVVINEEPDSNTRLLDDADVDESHEATIEAPTQSSRPTVNSSQAPVQPTRHVEDETSSMGIPRETIEEMMRAWSKVLVQGLRKEGSRGEGRTDDVELGELSGPVNVEIRPKDEIQPAENGEGFWDGGYVEVVSDEEIRAEDERRSLELEAEVDDYVAMMRQGNPNFELGDPTANCWATYWIGNDEARPERQRREPRTWRGTKQEMKKAQLQLWILLLGPIRYHEDYSCCYMKLIGQRLYHMSKTTSDKDNTRTIDEQVCRLSNGATFLQIVIEHMWLVRRRKHGVTVNELLKACWQRRVLGFQSQWPLGQEPPWSLVRASIYLVLMALHSVDLWGYPRVSELSCSSEDRNSRHHYSFDIEAYVNLWENDNSQDDTKIAIEKFASAGEPLDERQLLVGAKRFLLRSLPAVLRDLQEGSESCSWNDMPLSGEECSGAHFRRESFNAIVLQEVGGIQICWTSYLDEHLGLFTGPSGETKLRLFWFDGNRNYLRALGWGEFQSQWEEAARSMQLIFGHNAKCRKAYHNIGLPEWYCCSETQTKPSGLKLEQISCSNVQAHIVDLYPGLPVQIPYSNYPHCEKRLRNLKHYLDSQAPTGLWGLWRDKRNSYSFYTLWLVVIFGGISILLALASLVVSSLQTWAAFHRPGD